MSDPQAIILVIANLNVRDEDRVAPTLAVLRGLADASRKEAGCVRYEVLQHAVVSTQLVTVEEWRGEAAVAAHTQSGHVKAALAQLEPLLAGPPQIVRYRDLG